MNNTFKEIKEKFKTYLEEIMKFNLQSNKLNKVSNYNLIHYDTNDDIYTENIIKNMVKTVSYYKQKEDLIRPNNYNEISVDNIFNKLKKKNEFQKNKSISFYNNQFIYFSNYDDIKEEFYTHIQNILNYNSNNTESIIKNFQLMVNFLQNYIMDFTDLIKTIQLINN